MQEPSLITAKTNDAEASLPEELALRSESVEPTSESLVTNVMAEGEGGSPLQSELPDATLALDISERESLLRDSWTAMTDRFNWFWRVLCERFFRDLSIRDERVETLQKAAEEGTLVYVLRSQSYLNYLIYNFLFLQKGLPLSCFAQGLYWLPWQRLTKQLRVFLGWIGRFFGYGGKGPDELFRGLVRHQQTTLIFLKRPFTLYHYVRRGMYWLQNRIRGLFGRPIASGGRQVDLIEELVKLQRQQERPIFLCPLVLVWDPIPASTRKTFWDVVFGEKEFPGLLREIYLFLRNRSKSQVRGGAPINLKEVLEQAPKKLTDADIARKLRWQMLDRFAKETRVVTGPKLRPAAELKARVLGAHRVRAAIQAEAEENQVPVSVVERRARKILERMAAHFSLVVAKRLDWLLNKFWSRMYQRWEGDEPGLHGIDVDREGIERVREASKEAPLVLLPSHKSHVDYLILSQICLHYGMVPPHIAAGDNLAIPIIGWLFRRSGAFFIRRSFKGDQLYKAIFLEYLHRLLREGYNIEFFIEGGRSRTGKLRLPKMGMLSMLIDGILDKRIRDFHLAPISITYDRIVEGESYTRELLGQSKKKESLRGLLRSWDVLKVNFGRIYVRFAEPFSARTWIEQHIEEERRHHPTYDPVSSKEDRKHLVRTLAFLVVHEINEVSVVMPTAVVAALLMTHSQRGISHQDLVARTTWLCEEIRRRNGRLPVFDDMDLVVKRTIAFLGRLIKKPANLLEPVYRPSDSRRLELGYYRNQVMHLFLDEGVVACALFSFRQFRREDEGVSREQLLDAVRLLSQLLKLEFIFNPSQDIEANFQETLEKMSSLGMLTCEGDRVKVASEQGSMLSFLWALFLPFLDSYWVASLSFFSLLDGEPVEQKELLATMRAIAETLYHEGYIRYSDVVSMESLQNALALFQELGVLRTPSVEESTRGRGRRGSKENHLVLCEHYQNDEVLRAYATRIGKLGSCREVEKVVTRMHTFLAPKRGEGELTAAIVARHASRANSTSKQGEKDGE